MGFGQVLFLVGIMTVAGPILIHLLIRPRFKRIAYTMIAFLEVSQKQSRATRRLREWLILLMRCAIVVLLACMFALPFIRSQGEVAARPDRHIIVVDNSVSMAYQDRGQSLLARAIEKAIEYVAAHQTGDTLFDVYTGDGRPLGSKLAAPDAIAALRRITTTAHRTDMAAIPGAAAAALAAHEDTYVYLVSDFTPSAMKALAPCQSMRGLQDVKYDVIAAHEPSNALVKDARVARYDQDVVELLVEVENSGATPQKRLLRASASSKRFEVTAEDVPVELSAASSRDYLLKLRISTEVMNEIFLPVEISLSPSDALAPDDTYFLGVQIKPSPQQRILIAGRNAEQSFLILEALQAISRADFDNNLVVRLNAGASLDRAKLDSSDVLFCGHIHEGFDQDTEVLDRFFARGGTAVFFVSPDMSVSSAQRLYDEGLIGAEPLELIDRRSLLTASWPSEAVFTRAGLDVETARAIRHYTLDEMPLWSHFACRQHPESRGLWSLETGHYLVYARAAHTGKTLLINTSMDDSMSTLTKRPVVIPLCRLVLGSGTTAYGYGVHADERAVLPILESERGLASAGKSIWALDPSGERHRIAVAGSILTGHYPHQIGWLRTLSDPVRYAGINVTAGETNLQAAETTEIDQYLAGATSTGRRDANPGELATATVDSNRPIWKLLAWSIIALVFVEGFVVNRMKR